MTRQSLALRLAAATALTVVALSATFALLRNVTPMIPKAPSTPPAAQPPSPVADPVRLAAGRATFERLNCAMCHAIAGRGNPSLPLDGVGSRRDRDALSDWSFGTGAAAGSLPAGIAQIKARGAQDPDRDALLDFLQQAR